MLSCEARCLLFGVNYHLLHYLSVHVLKYPALLQSAFGREKSFRFYVQKYVGGLEFKLTLVASLYITVHKRQITNMTQSNAIKCLKRTGLMLSGSFNRGDYRCPF